jgi:hypothetical protein
MRERWASVTVFLRLLAAQEREVTDRVSHDRGDARADRARVPGEDVRQTVEGKLI